MTAPAPSGRFVRRGRCRAPATAARVVDMIRLLRGMPTGVLGIEAVDDVEKEDYENVIIPAVEAALAEHGEHDAADAARHEGVVHERHQCPIPRPPSTGSKTPVT